MAKSQARSRRKVSGTRYVDYKKKKQYELGGEATLTQIGTQRLKTKRVMGGNTKISLLSSEFVFVSLDGKTSKLKIESVSNNPANVNFTRRNLITKGCIVKTEKGDVKITSRPGQSGNLFGVLL